MSDEASVLVDRWDGIAIVTLNRPEALNALDRRTRGALARVFASLQADSDVRVVILTGKGRAFCAGLDLKEMGAGANHTDEEGVAMRAAIESFDRPLIGAINGFAITGGFELALMCDFLLAASTARFADTHARVGVVPGWGLSQRLPRLIGAARAKQVSFTGNYVTAESAERWGFVNEVVAPENLMARAREVAQEIVSCDPVVVREIKRLVDAGAATTLAEGLDLEDAASRQHMAGLGAEDIAARRVEVQRRGREQSRG